MITVTKEQIQEKRAVYQKAVERFDDHIRSLEQNLAETRSARTANAGAVVAMDDLLKVFEAEEEAPDSE